jgi:hypothetical protein
MRIIHSSSLSMSRFHCSPTHYQYCSRDQRSGKEEKRREVEAHRKWEEGLWPLESIGTMAIVEAIVASVFHLPFRLYNSQHRNLLRLAARSTRHSHICSLCAVAAPAGHGRAPMLSLGLRQRLARDPPAPRSAPLYAWAA